jgi:TatD DNase family protein
MEQNRKYAYIDVHTHVNLDAFKDDFREVAHHTHDEGVAYINVGTGEETSLRAVQLMREGEGGVYATVGLHPVRAGGSHDDDGTPPETFDRSYYEGLARDSKVVAIGECGFDYFRVEKETKAKQEDAFIAQIALANDLGKPLMLHIRDVKGSMGAYEDAIAVLKAHAKVLGNVHFFAGTYDIAKKFWDMGYTTSFTGVITFAKEYDETIKGAPLDMLHAETDAPYVAPVPFRGTRNEPLHVREVYRRIAVLRGEDAEVVRIQLLKNAERLFGVAIT